VPTSKERIGVGVVGSGRIGSLRAHLAAGSPRVGFLALADKDPARAAAVAQQTEAAFHSADNRAVIAHPEVDAVIVSTPEGEHAEAVCLALELGKPVLVEKPVALSLAEADRILAAQARSGADLFVGYTQRLRRRFLSVKEHIEAGRLGEVMAGRLNIYHSRSDARQMRARAEGATPFTNSLTYMADLALWFFAPRRPARVYAVGGGEVFPDPPGLGDHGWAIVTFGDGAAASLGASWILPAKWPAYVASMGMDLFGSEGAIAIDDGHKDVVLAVDGGLSLAGAPEPLEVAFLGSAMPGDWAMGDFYGPMREESRLFIERAATGRAVPLCTGAEGRAVLELTLAMERSARGGGEVVPLPLAGG
jgi:predicted dehydrogenase